MPEVSDWFGSLCIGMLWTLNAWQEEVTLGSEGFPGVTRFLAATYEVYLDWIKKLQVCAMWQRFLHSLFGSNLRSEALATATESW
mmetsp:Transcript_45493/g.75323  ORF Transcript_45493/g.75323 Transcript_45493/m.75323 type:complete len:85 (+) Transcript_45493:643-897(+)